MFDFDIWFSEQAVILKSLPDYKRYLFNKIDWNSSCVGILGARGTGKTTLMLQRLKNIQSEGKKALYISVDNPRFQELPLNEFAYEFSKQGGEVLFLDEVHKYPDWSKHVKASLDTRSELRIVFSGSSLLQMHKQDADLSRRAVFYHLDGMSFREYLRLSENINIQQVEYETILKEHEIIAHDIHNTLKSTLKYFKEYLAIGYYPFFLKDFTSFRMKLSNTIQEVLEADLGFVCDIKYGKVHQLKKLLYMLANTPPYEIKKTSLSDATGIDRVTMNDYLLYMQKACLLNLVKPAGAGDGSVRKSEKLLLNNTNIQFAISNNPDLGTTREIFFVNQLTNYFRMQDSFLPVTLEYPKNGDYQIEGRVFEVGGRKKDFRQLKGIDLAYVVSDDIEIGYLNRIPLWLFGMMY